MQSSFSLVVIYRRALNRHQKWWFNISVVSDDLQSDLIGLTESPFTGGTRNWQGENDLHEFSYVPKSGIITPLYLFCVVLYPVYKAFLTSQMYWDIMYCSVNGWLLTTFPICYPLILLCSMLLCAERCGRIAYWDKLVFLHLGKWTLG